MCELQDCRLRSGRGILHREAVQLGREHRARVNTGMGPLEPQINPLIPTADIACIGLDVHKETTAVALAEGRRRGEVRPRG